MTAENTHVPDTRTPDAHSLGAHVPDAHVADAHALDGIELADAVASIRNQLIDAAARATDHPVSFAVGDIQMEFTLELRREARAGGKVKAWVVEAGADAARTTGRTHKVAFTLTPRNAATGEAWEIGTEDDGSTAGFGDAAARP
ncbi:trypco2 family protein [Streptomyces sp. NPDC051657]|uniref:trypco2 family protein n=1 Tax=unclassified Streptomyces TaxID=2593676 RepID=UPI00342C7B06